MDSLNGLDKLLEAEAAAAKIIRDAEAEAGALLGAARESAHAAEKEKLTKLHAERDAAYQAASADIKEKLRRDLEDFEKNLVGTPLDQAALAKSCERFMASEA